MSIILTFFSSYDYLSMITASFGSFFSENRQNFAFQPPFWLDKLVKICVGLISRIPTLLFWCKKSFLVVQDNLCEKKWPKRLKKVFSAIMDGKNCPKTKYFFVFIF